MIILVHVVYVVTVRLRIISPPNQPWSYFSPLRPSRWRSIRGSPNTSKALQYDHLLAMVSSHLNCFHLCCRIRGSLMRIFRGIRGLYFHRISASAPTAANKRSAQLQSTCGMTTTANLNSTKPRWRPPSRRLCMTTMKVPMPLQCFLPIILWRASSRSTPTALRTVKNVHKPSPPELLHHNTMPALP